MRLGCRFDLLWALESKPKSKTVKVEMISIGVIITPTHYSSADCTAIARGRCLLLPLSRQEIEQKETKITKFLSIRVESIRAFWLCHPGDDCQLRMGSRCSRDGVLFLKA